MKILFLKIKIFVKILLDQLAIEDPHIKQNFVRAGPRYTYPQGMEACDRHDNARVDLL